MCFAISKTILETLWQKKLIVHFMNFRYVLESEHMKKFFDYIQLPNFDIASDASATFKVRLTSKLFEKRYIEL